MFTLFSDTTRSVQTIYSPVQGAGSNRSRKMEVCTENIQILVSYLDENTAEELQGIQVIKLLLVHWHALD